MKRFMNLSDSAAFYYIALLVMLHKNKSSIIPEVCHILSPEQILLFVKMFEGETVRVPTRKELADSLLMALAIYYRHVLSFPWKMIEEKLSISSSKMRGIKQSMDAMIAQLQEDTGFTLEELLNV